MFPFSDAILRATRAVMFVFVPPVVPGAEIAV
jgi:hypothetical protein